MRKANENLKPRLTEAGDILQAVAFLRARGREDEDLTRELVCHFHVDLDTLNAILRLTSNPT